MSEEQVVAVIITITTFGLLCAWIPLLEFLAALVRRRILIQKLGRIVIGKTFLEDYASLLDRG